MDDQAQLISCSYSSEACLYLSYMPFIKGGGLFLRTNHVCPLGKAVELSLKLINEHEPYLVLEQDKVSLFQLTFYLKECV